MLDRPGRRNQGYALVKRPCQREAARRAELCLPTDASAITSQISLHAISPFHGNA